ncbi:1-acyl-sn-glycerol-3-phosphate acyltransferase [Bryocella elongata]|uniref:1-acyl-sn-glycerol-3-phosphate acyltransferase n=1 Tax=Bryocella elongata TaxID=863522 RepID=A0A1H5Y1G1_9BACT|nr:lysophospholipid acyltransferase family protein [Bryocella elongata]SEG17919.1 1-acyl-sn-glycerol-3-phosphate acyltransferase [Bryocella elongata]
MPEQVTLRDEPQAEESQAPVVAVPPRPQIPLPLQWLTYLLLMPLVGIATGAFGTLSLLVGLWDGTGRQQHWVARQWARVLLRIAMAPIKVEGVEHLQPLRRSDSHRPVAVYASNHLSYYDTPALFAKLPFQFRILAKASLWKVPFIGWYLQRSGQVPIDTGSGRSLIASLGRGVKTLDSGLPLVLFPEGGRTPDGEVKTMVAGAAWMAIKAQVPLVPITLVGTYELLPMHTYVLRPRPLKLIIGEPIDTMGMTTRDADALTKRLRQIIHDTYIAETTSAEGQ